MQFCVCAENLHLIYSYENPQKNCCNSSCSFWPRYAPNRLSAESSIQAPVGELIPFPGPLAGFGSGALQGKGEGRGKEGRGKGERKGRGSRGSEVGHPRFLDGLTPLSRAYLGGLGVQSPQKHRRIYGAKSLPQRCQKVTICPLHYYSANNTHLKCHHMLEQLHAFQQRLCSPSFPRPSLRSSPLSYS